MVWRTTFITISTCFLLGTTFTHWIADHDVLWKRPITESAVDTSIKYYSILNSAPKTMLYAYFGMIALTLISAGGRMIKVFKGGKGEVVFDGGSVVLIAAIVHTQLTETLPTILAFPSPLPKTMHSTLFAHLSSSVRELATDNIKCAVMLTGVMLLQGGRYYAKRPSRQPVELVDQSGNDSSTEASSPEVKPARPGTPYRELTEEEALDLAQ